MTAGGWLKDSSITVALISPFLAVVFTLASCATKSDLKKPAELLLKNGRIYTMDAARSWAHALAVSEGRIILVGSDQDAEDVIGPETHVIDLKGRMVLPGFHDSHSHPLTGGMELGLCNLNGLETQQQVLEAIRRYAEDRPEKFWILGGGWDLPLFPAANPSRELLDRVVNDRPVFLTAADGHSAWVNSKALEIAGIDAATIDPPGGQIERRPGTTEPSGTLRENAMDLVESQLPEVSLRDRVEGLRRGLEMASRFGITSLQEARAPAAILEAYRELDRQKQLKVRVVASQQVSPQKGVEQIATLIANRENYKGPRLRATAAKIFVDGVIESHTAALLEPYLDRPSSSGTPNLTADALNELVSSLDASDFQVHLHAIGDQAVRMALDALQEATARNGPKDLRHHIAHLQLIDPADIGRFRLLGVVANFQPLWAYPDTYITELTLPVLGPARSAWLYPMASIFKSGAVMVAGSDWSVSSMNPLDGIQVAMTRRALSDDSQASWLPEQRMNLPDMLAAYTINGAYLSYMERSTGSLEVGKLADLLVLDRNLFELSEQDIHTARVVLTLVEGEAVFSEQEFRF